MVGPIARKIHVVVKRARLMPWLAAAVMAALGCPSSTPPGPASACRPTAVADAAPHPLISKAAPEVTAVRPEPAPTATGRQALRPHLRFERNDGQADPRVRFLSRGRNYTLFLTADEAVFAFADAAPVPQADQSRAHILRIQFVDGSSAAGVRGLDPLPGTSHYLVGADPLRWQTDVPNFGRVLIEDLYPGVNVVYYGHDDRLEYDLILAAGADPARIGFHFGGARSLRLDGDGTLVADAGEGRVRLEKPVIYQEEPGGRRLVAGGYVLRGNGEAGVEVGPYDPSRSLVIDPVIAYSTFLGGDEADQGESIVFDASGHAYITGTSSSATFPTTPDACQPKKSGGGDVFITKLAADGSTVLYSTFLGGGSHDQGWAIAVDRDGEALITGTTASDDFPMTNAFQPAFGGGAGDAFVAKLNARGAGLVFSTYLGGSALDEGRGIAVDAKGDVYVTGTTGSADFRSRSAFQPAFGGGTDAFVVKLPGSGSQGPMYSTFLGGRGADVGKSIAVDAADRVFITGTTDSPDFPLHKPIQRALGGHVDAFVTQFTATGAALVYSTYLGGAQSDAGSDITVDPSGHVYVTGDTTSPDFPVAAALQPKRAGAIDAFVTRIDPTGSRIVYSTYLGGRDIDIGRGIAIDARGVVYVTGVTGSPDFPLRNPIQRAIGGALDAFVSRISPDGSSLLSSTYLGGTDLDYASGIAVDGMGALAVIGQTASKDFPTTSGAFRRLFNGGRFDAFVVKIDEP